MALYSNPPHRVNTFAVASSTDAGGGNTLTYTLAQSGVPCSINTASSSEVEKWAQMQQTVTHTVAFLSSALTTPLTRGMKLVTADTGESYHVKGISSGRQYGGIPPFTYAYCESLN